ncbi:MAG: TraB/GumN family protein [Cytophagales bacterium]|nr:TraB/GumN family protein [Bernardetiaceae bacterium]MDW8210028.1 TraB/GumN family protein [Cytophagales bacterium]
MKKTAFLAFFLLVLRFVDAQQQENALLWRISGNGLEKSSYLFGTIHLLCKQDFFLPPAVPTALQECQRLVTELNLSDPTVFLQAMHGIAMPNGKHLKDLLAATDYARLDKFFRDSVGLDLTFLGIVKPIFLSWLVTPRAINCPTVSYEVELIKIAKQQQKEIAGIETVADQLKALDAISLEQQAALLMQLLDQPSDQISQLINAYKNQDISALYQLIQQSDAAFKEYQQSLLVQRNRNWVERIAHFSAEKPTFYAVGAGHLAGEEGLIHLLRKKGFVVEAVY